MARSDQLRSDLHSFNHALRFFLEILALGTLAYWGWNHTDAFPVPISISLPVVAAAAWAIFRVPGDGPKPVIPVSGPVRLALELTLFSITVILVWAANRPVNAILFASLIILHYGISYRRVWWLSTQ